MKRRGIGYINQTGYTLIELLVAMVLSAIVLTAICSAYVSQQKAYTIEQQVSAIQQNVRVALYHLERDIREAGCDPTGDVNPGFQVAQAAQMQFTQDITGDGDTGDSDEDITYQLVDNDGDGEMDYLARNGVIIAENIDTLDFVYLDEDGNVLATPVVNTDLPNIRTVQVTIVARADQINADFTDSTSYANQQGTEILAAPNDHYRRRALTSTIRCRNLGM